MILALRLVDVPVLCLVYMICKLPLVPLIPFALMTYTVRIPTTPACTWWNRTGEDLSSGNLESTHPSRTVVKSIEVFMESNQL